MVFWQHFMWARLWVSLIMSAGVWGWYTFSSTIPSLPYLPFYLPPFPMWIRIVIFCDFLTIWNVGAPTASLALSASLSQTLASITQFDFGAELYTFYLSAGQCELENNIHYSGNDDYTTDGKIKCASAINPSCTQTAFDDASSCKSFCYSSKYFTFTNAKECFCKNLDSAKSQEGGTISGRTNCQAGKLGHWT